MIIISRQCTFLLLSFFIWFLYNFIENKIYLHFLFLSNQKKKKRKNIKQKINWQTIHFFESFIIYSNINRKLMNIKII